jgi:hypothetical protein
MTRVKQTVSRQAPWVAFGAVMLIANVSCGKIPEAAVEVKLTPAVEIAEVPSITGKVTLQGADAAKLHKIVDVGGNPFCTGHGDIVDASWRVGADRLGKKDRHPSGGQTPESMAGGERGLFR